MQWIDANQQKPEVNGHGVSARLLVFVPELLDLAPVNPVQMGRYYSTRDDWRLIDSQSTFEVTHWMPLPEPPTE